MCFVGSGNFEKLILLKQNKNPLIVAMWTWKIKYHGTKNLLGLEIDKTDFEE